MGEWVSLSSPLVPLALSSSSAGAARDTRELCVVGAAAAAAADTGMGALVAGKAPRRLNGSFIAAAAARVKDQRKGMGHTPPRANSRTQIQGPRALTLKRAVM